MAVAMLHISVLGPLEVEPTTSDGERLPALRLPNAHGVDCLLRSIASRPQGLQVTEAEKHFNFHGSRAVHDAASALRSLLSEYGLSLTRVPYRIVTHDGERVLITTDLDAFEDVELAIVQLDRQGAEALQSEVPSMLALLNELDSVVDSWRRADHHQLRAKFLGELSTRSGRKRLIELDESVRYHRARIAVSLAQRSPSLNHVERAERSLREWDGNAHHGSVAIQLRRQLAAVKDSLDDFSEPIEASADIFLSMPMIGSSDYGAARNDAVRVIHALQQHCGVGEVFWAGAVIEDSSAFEEPSVGLGRNMPYFRSAKHFVMIYPEKTTSGVLVEAGLAMGLGMPAVYFVRDRSDLPWILQDVGGANDNKLGRVRVVKYCDVEDLINKIRRNGSHLFTTRDL